MDVEVEVDVVLLLVGAAVVVLGAAVLLGFCKRIHSFGTESIRHSGWVVVFDWYSLRI